MNTNDNPFRLALDLVQHAPDSKREWAFITSAMFDIGEVLYDGVVTATRYEDGDFSITAEPLQHRGKPVVVTLWKQDLAMVKELIGPQAEEEDEEDDFNPIAVDALSDLGDLARWLTQNQPGTHVPDENIARELARFSLPPARLLNIAAAAIGLTDRLAAIAEVSHGTQGNA